jgi:hypothetical protein
MVAKVQGIQQGLILQIGYHQIQDPVDLLLGEIQTIIIVQANVRHLIMGNNPRNRKHHKHLLDQPAIL